MNRLNVIGVGAVLSLAISVAAIAHHGWTGYEQESQKVTGTIEKSSYSNPHASIRLKAPDKSWVVVLAPPSRMGNRGLTEEMLKVGSTVSVEGYQHMTDANEMRAERISVNGKTIELR